MISFYLKQEIVLKNLFNFKFIYIDESAARYLTEKEISGVGIDALGVERDQSDHDS